MVHPFITVKAEFSMVTNYVLKSHSRYAQPARHAQSSEIPEISKVSVNRLTDPSQFPVLDIRSECTRLFDKLRYIPKPDAFRGFR